MCWLWTLLVLIGLLAERAQLVENAEVLGPGISAQVQHIAVDSLTGWLSVRDSISYSADSVAAATKFSGVLTSPLERTKIYVFAAVLGTAPYLYVELRDEDSVYFSYGIDFCRRLMWDKAERAVQLMLLREPGIAVTDSLIAQLTLLQIELSRPFQPRKYIIFTNETGTDQLGGWIFDKTVNEREKVWASLSDEQRNAVDTITSPRLTSAGSQTVVKLFYYQGLAPGVRLFRSYWKQGRHTHSESRSLSDLYVDDSLEFDPKFVPVDSI